MKWSYEGISRDGTIKIYPEIGIDLEPPLFEVRTFDGAIRACKEHNKIEVRVTEAENKLKIAQRFIRDLAFGDGKSIRGVIDFDEEIEEFLGGNH